MVLRPLDKSVLKRLRSVVKREQVKSGRRFPKRVLRAFGRLKNIDERTLLVRSLGIPQRNSKRIDAWEDKMLRGPGQGVRLLKLKSGEVVMKFPTLAARHYKVTPSEEIKFVRRLTGMVNTNLAGNGFQLLKPIGHPVGPFIAMQRTKLPNVGDLFQDRIELMSPRARKMLSKLSKEMGIPQEELKEKIIKMGIDIGLEAGSILYDKKLAISKNYPAGPHLENKKTKLTFNLSPLDAHHLQIVGQKKWVIQFVPYLDAV